MRTEGMCVYDDQMTVDVYEAVVVVVLVNDDSLL